MAKEMREPIETGHVEQLSEERLSQKQRLAAVPQQADTIKPPLVDKTRRLPAKKPGGLDRQPARSCRPARGRAVDAGGVTRVRCLDDDLQLASHDVVSSL